MKTSQLVLVFRLQHLKAILTIWSFLFALTLIGQEDIDPGSKEARMKAEMTLIDGQKHMILENYAKALEMFETAREIIGDDPAIHFKIAEVLYQSNEHDRAIVSARKAIELDPSNKFYYVLAADIETARGDLNSAQKLYEELLAMEGNEDYLGDLALIYEYQGKNKKALETFNKVQEHFGTNEGLVREMQKIYQLMGTPEKGLEEWKELAEAYPGQDKYLFDYINQLMNLDKIDEAKTYLEGIMDNDPGNPQAGLLMAEILKNEGNSSEAMRLAERSLLSTSVDFKLKGQILSDLLKSNQEASTDELVALTKKVAAIHPNEYTAQALTGDVLFQLERRQESIEYYLKATKIKPDNFALWQNILSIEAELGMWEELAKHSEEAMEYFPNQGALYHFAGTAQLRKSNYQRAAQYLEMGKRFALDNELKSAFEAQLGDAFGGLKNYPKSDQAYEDALALNTKNEHALNNYSLSLALRKTKLDRAIELSSQLIKLKPNNATYLDTHGLVLFAQGAFKEAKKFIEKAASTSDKPEITEHYGDVLFKLGQESEAIAAWERSVSMGNESQLILKKIADRKYYE